MLDRVGHAIGRRLTVLGSVQAVFLYGVVNASPDSLNADSIVDRPDAAVARARRLLADGADAIDLGGQGSTDIATVVDWHAEWARLEAIVPALAGLGVDVSIDSWRPEVVRRALEAGRHGDQRRRRHAERGDVAGRRRLRRADRGAVPVRAEPAGDDPRAPRPGRRDRRVLRGPPRRRRPLRAAPPLHRRPRHRLRPARVAVGGALPSTRSGCTRTSTQLRRFGLPLYIALPWKETAQHDELLEIVVRQQPEFGRAHYPAKVRAVRASRAVHG